MPAVSTSRVLSAVAFGLAILLTGCAGEETSSAGAGDDTSPLSEYYEKLFPEQSQEEMDAQLRESEAIVAACMQEAGFEYTPQDPSTDGGGVAIETEEEYGTEEYAAVHGYGITTYDPEADPSTEEYVDPNADYLATMSESEMTAFYEALYGTQSTEEYDPDAEAPVYDWTTAGCTGKAEHESAGGQLTADPAFAAFQEDTQALYEKAQDSPETAALNTAWADCMADAGYADLGTPEDAMNDINERSMALHENLSESNPMPDEAAMDELKKVEVDTAVADFRCQEDVDYADRSQAIMAELEREYIDTHRAELDALVEKYGRD